MISLTFDESEIVDLDQALRTAVFMVGVAVGEAENVVIPRPGLHESEAFTAFRERMKVLQSRLRQALERDARETRESSLTGGAIEH